MFEADADSMIRKLETTAAGQPTPEISKPKPDKHCMIAAAGYVFIHHTTVKPAYNGHSQKDQKWFSRLIMA